MQAPPAANSVTLNRLLMKAGPALFDGYFGRELPSATVSPTGSV